MMELIFKKYILCVLLLIHLISLSGEINDLSCRDRDVLASLSGSSDVHLVLMSLIFKEF